MQYLILGPVATPPHIFLIRYGNPEVLKKSQIKILDVGTGCGTIPISLSFFLKSIGDFEQLKIDIIEPNELFITEFHKLKDIVNSEKYGVSIICDNFKSGPFNDADIFVRTLSGVVLPKLVLPSPL